MDSVALLQLCCSAIYAGGFAEQRGKSRSVLVVVEVVTTKLRRSGSNSRIVIVTKRLSRSVEGKEDFVFEMLSISRLFERRV